MSGRRFTITLEGHGTAFCQSNERVLVALERAQGFGKLHGLPRKLPVGCRRGGCGVCKARVTKGDYRRAPMSRMHLSLEEEAAGFVLACSIYPNSDLSLHLDLSVTKKSKLQTGNIKTANS